MRPRRSARSSWTGSPARAWGGVCSERAAGDRALQDGPAVSRFLIVVPPLTGHILPTVAVAAELTSRGHEVAWAGNSAYLRSVLPTGGELASRPDAGARVFAVDDEFPGEPLSERLL